MKNENEIVIYQASQDLQLPVRLEKDTVWLTQIQIAELFGVKQPAISKHIKNIYASNELPVEGTYSILEYMGNEGKQVYETKYYNLDMILSIGYRVNSANATRFRQWANNVLKDYLLQGYAFNQRFERIEHRLANVEERQEAFDIEIHAALPPTQGVFFDGQVFSARRFVEDLVQKARREIVLVDTYVNSAVLDILDERAEGVVATIYTDKISSALRQDEALYFTQNKRYVTLKEYKANFHDRFLIIDDDLYHFGASFKDLGKRLFAFDKMNIDKTVILNQL